MKKPAVIDEKTLMEFKRLAAMVQNQSGIRLNVDQVVKNRDTECLRVWERTFQTKGDREFRKF